MGEERGPSGTPSWTAVSTFASCSSSESDQPSSRTGGGIEGKRGRLEDIKSVKGKADEGDGRGGQKSMNGIILEESSMAVAAEKLVGDVSDSSSSKLILRKASETRYLTWLEGKERERERN